MNIVITNEDTGVVREIVSTAEGSYFASQMVPGRYRIAAKLEGFKALDRRGITLTVGQTTTLDLTMEVGGLAETLTVTGEAPLVDVTIAEVGGHISADELNDLPAANRNYMAFVGNVPGTVFIPSARVPERQLPGQRPADGGQQHRLRRREQHRRAARIERRRPDPRRRTSRFRKCRSSPTSSTRSGDAPRARSSTP